MCVSVCLHFSEGCHGVAGKSVSGQVTGSSPGFFFFFLSSPVSKSPLLLSHGDVHWESLNLYSLSSFPAPSPSTGLDPPTHYCICVSVCLNYSEGCHGVAGKSVSGQVPGSSPGFFSFFLFSVFFSFLLCLNHL